LENKIIKILIIRFSSFGDIVLTFPLISIIKEKYPGCEIHFLTKHKYSSLLQLNDNIDLILFSNSDKTKHLIKYISEGNYDLIIDLQKNAKSIFCTFFTWTKVVRVKKDNIWKFLLVKFKIKRKNKTNPVFLKYINCCRNILNLDDTNFRTSSLNFFDERLIKNKYIVIAPASRHFTKTYPENKLIQIIESVHNCKIVLISDNIKNEVTLCRRLASLSNNILDYSGKLNYEALSNVLFYSELVFCNDSGILHLAEALGKKVICVFGSTVKEFGFFPQLKLSAVFENNLLKCRPCSHIGKNYCPEKHFKCMKDLNNSRIISLINDKIN